MSNIKYTYIIIFMYIAIHVYVNFPPVVTVLNIAHFLFKLFYKMCQQFTYILHSHTKCTNIKVMKCDTCTGITGSLRRTDVDGLLGDSHEEAFLFRDSRDCDSSSMPISSSIANSKPST